ncbi:MAG TPA: hypothetical protein VJC21_01390 [Candidatus Nanoarchaeia archaeon]|nr:hypothetical protein [Candidatus Nanoarchaeia archaeon]
MKTKRLINSFFIVAIVVIILFFTDSIFSNLDQDYFKKHQEELTIAEIVDTPDGEGTNYSYADTPYSKLAHFSFWLYFLIPPLLVMFLSGRYLLKEKKYLLSLLLPFSFILLTFILQAKNIYNAVGWEKDFGIMMVSLYVAAAFVLTLIINSIILFKIRKSKKKRKPYK